jgi:hypothetical protein
MSRNYQMHQMARDEADRFDAYDRAVEAREAMAREQEQARVQAAKLKAIDDLNPAGRCQYCGHQMLTPCETAQRMNQCVNAPRD